MSLFSATCSYCGEQAYFWGYCSKHTSWIPTLLLLSIAVLVALVVLAWLIRPYLRFIGRRLVYPMIQKVRQNPLPLTMIVLLVVALFPIPEYGYYVLTKFVVCGGCAYLAVRAYKAHREKLVWFLGGLSLLYNPISEFPLGRELWIFVDVVTIALLAKVAFGKKI